MGGSSRKGGSKQQTQTVNQVSMPPAWARPLFEKGAAEANRLYEEGKGGGVYQGQRVADLSKQTRSGIDGMQGLVGQFDDEGLKGLAFGGTRSGDNLGAMARGDMIGNNTHFNEALQNTLNNAATTINSQMSGAGRYGSGAHSGVLANNLGQIATSAMSDQYNRDVANMMAANGQIDAANQGQLGAAAGYLGQKGNAQRGALEAAGLLDQHNQNKVNADWQKWNEEDNADWTRLGLLESAANGFAGQYGNQNSTTVGQASGGRSSGLMNTLGGVGSFLGGLLNKSDIRAKFDIVEVGERAGFKLYDFCYKGDEERRRYRGVMAQDILKVMPEAVCVDPQDGLLCVNYGLLGFGMERVFP